MTGIISTTEDERPAVDWGELRPGEQVEAHRGAVLHHRGVVEETVPHLGVVWIRDISTGTRKMLSHDDVVLRRCRP
ncbi:hypothetical protein [Kocuria sp. NPDC057446]|uniref:hypothetical protein n=1 Tax=Kocuria sp. NPDC057446 TaxID=3346137 RepID=UPI00368FD4F9